MTIVEKTLYDKIKQDPNHPLFSFLFKKNFIGEVTPIQGKILKIMSDGIPMIVDAFPFNSLNSQSSVADPFTTIRTTKSFRDISNEIALVSPFGKNSMFYREEREILKGQIPRI